MAKLASLSPHELVNIKSQVFKKMGVKLQEIDKDGVIKLMLENPRIIIRPLLSDGRQVLLRFNEEQYQKITN